MLILAELGYAETYKNSIDAGTLHEHFNIDIKHSLYIKNNSYLTDFHRVAIRVCVLPLAQNMGYKPISSLGGGGGEVERTRQDFHFFLNWDEGLCFFLILN